MNFRITGLRGGGGLCTPRGGVENDFQNRFRPRLPSVAMIVCLCKAVSSRTILTEIRRGNCSVPAIARACEAGTGCGACIAQIRELIATTGTAARGHDDRPSGPSSPAR
jgi:bacterioferritin-associated ferredoxin